MFGIMDASTTIEPMNWGIGLRMGFIAMLLVLSAKYIWSR